MLNLVLGDGLLCLNGTTLLLFLMIEKTPYLDITILMKSVVSTLGNMENADKKLQFIGAI